MRRSRCSRIAMATRWRRKPAISSWAPRRTSSAVRSTSSERFPTIRVCKPPSALECASPTPSKDLPPPMQCAACCLSFSRRRRPPPLARHQLLSLPPPDAGVNMDTRATWKAFAAGDMAARDSLLTENLSLVHHVARQLERKLSNELDHDELVSAGTLGLMSAMGSFDPDRGLAFSTFAVPRIRGAILDEL